MRTLDLVAEAGLDYVTDWINDDMPYPVNAASGKLTALPLAWDLSDLHLLFQQHMDTGEFVEQVLRAFKTLYAEAAQTGSGRILTLTITPWLMGQPHRIRALGDDARPDSRARRRMARDGGGDRRRLARQRLKTPVRAPAPGGW